MNPLRLASLLDARRATLRPRTPDGSAQDTTPPGPQPQAVDPAMVGMDPVLLHKAVTLAHRRGGSAQLCVRRHGQVVIAETINCAPDSLFWLFSTSKPYTTVLIHQLAERGVLDLDDRVATYWPEFAGVGRNLRGKGKITIRQVLQHRTGFATAGGALADALVCTDWQQAIRAIEQIRPRRQPGTDPAYQFLIFGFILGEVVQRITGRPYVEVLDESVITPLQVHDTHLGIGPDLLPRAVPVEFAHRGGAMAANAINRPETRRAVMPSAGISATAWDVTTFYQMLLDGGRVGDHRLIAPETIVAARTPSTEREVDRFVRSPVPWSEGFQLGGSRGPGRVPPYGYRSTRNTFGHNGSNCCVGWADPDRDLAFAYLTNLRTHVASDIAHHAAVADLVFAACH